MASITVDSTTKSQNYITQVSVGGKAYDIVPYHGITFKEGNSGTGVKYDGLSEVTVTIPTVADLLQNPLQFIGTIGSNGKVMSGATEVTSFAKGYLAYFTEKCSFDTNIDGTQACEAGDMAICVGVSEGKPQWKIVTGENQVTVLPSKAGELSTVYLTSTPKNVLDVEGKTLALGVKLNVTPTTSSVAVTGTATVNPKYITLTSAETTADVVSKSIPTAVASGSITIPSANLKTAISNAFSLTPGTLPALSIVNTATPITVSETSGSISYVTSISGNVLSSVSLKVDGTVSDSVTVLNGLTGTTTFATGITTGSSTDKTFSVPKEFSVDKEYAYGWATETTTSGDVLSSVSFSGNAPYNSLSKSTAAGENVVVTDVNVGSLAADASADTKFVTDLATGTSLSTGYDVVTSVTLSSAGAVTSNSATVASVSKNVLVISDTKFAYNVGYAAPSLSVLGKKFSKTGLKISGSSVSYGKFGTASLSKKYKSLNKATPVVSVATNDYYKVATGTVGATTTTISLSKSTATVNSGSKNFLTKVSAEIPAKTLVSTKWGTTPVYPTIQFNEVGDVKGALDSTALNTGNTIFTLANGDDIKFYTYDLGTATTQPASSVDYVTVGAEGGATVQGQTDNTVMTDVTVTTVAN